MKTKTKNGIEDHDCRDYVDTKWRFNNKTGDWEIVFDYCTKCGCIITEHTAVNEFE